MVVKRAALFDVDKTLVSVNTARLYARWRMRRQEVGVFDYLRLSKTLFEYKLGTLDPESAAREAFASIAGQCEATLRNECREWYGRAVRKHISDRGRREVERCLAAGITCAILSASTPYITEPLAEELGIEHLICTRLEVRDGAFTGGWEPPLCYGAGKVTHAVAWAQRHGVDLSQSTFYTDSISDLPMLERVGSPRIVNPDPRLLMVARWRGYPVEKWK
ncbi:MAG: HAD family hydrolase [Myxococcales bacterium]